MHKRNKRNAEKHLTKTQYKYCKKHGCSYQHFDSCPLCLCENKFNKRENKMKILLIDADSKIPNLALMKLSTYYKKKGAQVDLMRLNIPFQNFVRKRKVKRRIIDATKYDKGYCSIIFEEAIAFFENDDIIIKGNVEYGGTGFDLKIKLPENIESLPPDYDIYPDNDISYGFISRGCIRNCYFCKVPRKEGMIKQVATVDEIVKHDKVRFMDNNFLALPNHIEILKELVDKQIDCEFNQGLDIRLITKQNSELLSKLNYTNRTYTFAFDDYKLLDIVKKKVLLLNWRKDQEIRFFLYCNADMEISNVVRRIEFLKNHNLLPYFMRDKNCFTSVRKNFYADLANYCNFHPYFTGFTGFPGFKDFLKHKGYDNKNRKRYNESVKLYYDNINRFEKGEKDEQIQKGKQEQVLEKGDKQIHKKESKQIHKGRKSRKGDENGFGKWKTNN